MAIEIIAIVIGFSILLAHVFPDQTEKWYKRMVKFREVIFGLFGLIVALVFIGSGNVMLMSIGTVMLIYGTLWMFFDRPYQEIKKLIND